MHMEVGRDLIVLLARHISGKQHSLVLHVYGISGHYRLGFPVHHYPDDFIEQVPETVIIGHNGIIYFHLATAGNDLYLIEPVERITTAKTALAGCCTTIHAVPSIK
jgi:hypothetical protein